MFALVTLKAFGDLVVARWALRRLAPQARPLLVLGDHLAELHDTLGDAPTALLARHGERGVPAVFDVRKAGLAQACRSGRALRRALRALPLPPEATLLFDRVGTRERFLAGGRSLQALPPAPNIYLAYTAALLDAAAPQTWATAVGAKIGVFPGSRIPAKALPTPVVVDLLQQLRRRGREPEVFVLDGEDDPLRGTGLPSTTVPRRFAAMVAAVRSVSAVVSADSMPAHLAEYFDLPVFVVSPVDNAYWLPLSSYRHGQWSLFCDAARTRRALDQFIASGP